MAGQARPALPRRCDRRQFLRTLALGSAALVACQAPAPASPPGQAAAPAPAPGAPLAPAAPASGWEAEWNALVDAAKREGKLILWGPPTPEVRTAVPAAFKNRFGIEVEYLGGRTTEQMEKLRAERLAGQYTLDVMVAGAQSLYTVAYPERLLDPIPPVLIHPEATDGSKWVRGKPWFMDPEERYLLRLANYVSSGITINREYVNPAEIKAYRDLLDPRYRGRISAYDPIRPGTGWNTANYLLRTLGDDYIRALYQGQQPGISNDSRQLSDWLARGTHPVSLGVGSDEVDRLRRDGFPIEVLTDLADAPGYVTAGFGLAALVNNAPHPNAAKLFINWIAMKEGNEAYNRAQVLVSTRTDVDNAWAPPYIIPRPGVDYFDTYDWDFTVNSRQPEQLNRLRELTGQN